MILKTFVGYLIGLCPEMGVENQKYCVKCNQSGRLKTRDVSGVIATYTGLVSLLRLKLGFIYMIENLELVLALGLSQWWC